MVNFDILFQGPSPFATPATIDPLIAAGGGGINNGTLIGLAGGVLIAAIPLIKSWQDNRNNMAAQTTQTALNSHTAMLTSALQRADRLEAQLSELQKSFTELKSEFATVKTQLADKTAELTAVTHERDALKLENTELKNEIIKLRLGNSPAAYAAAQFVSDWNQGKASTEVKT